MSEELIPMAPIEEKMSQELVKANVTEAVIASLRERYMPLKIAGLEDKETYLQVKEARKECKSLRVMAKKICTNGREEATAIQKAWIAKEKEVTGKIAEVEDYLEAQEKEYEEGIAAEKEARKRRQEEQLILRQQILTKMGVLYTDGCFVLGDVSFEYSAIKESDVDVWIETIYPAFDAEYQKIQVEEIEKERLRKEQEAELKRQQEQLEEERRKLKEEADRLKAEKERQEVEAAKKRSDQFEFRSQQLKSIGFESHGVDMFAFREFIIPMETVWNWDENNWSLQLSAAHQYVDKIKEEEAEAKRKEHDRAVLQNKRYAEIFPFLGGLIEMDNLWELEESSFQEILSDKKADFEKKEEEKRKRIAEESAKAERERIEEEQRKLEQLRVKELGEIRMFILQGYNSESGNTIESLGKMDELSWDRLRTESQNRHEEIIRKQEEERKAEELAQASDKEKWEEIMSVAKTLEAIATQLSMRSGQYRKKAAILREKLEEIKAL